MGAATSEVLYGGAYIQRVPSDDGTEGIAYTYRFDVDNDYLLIDGNTVLEGESGTLFDIAPHYASHIDSKSVKNTATTIYHEQLDKESDAMLLTFFAGVTGAITIGVVGVEVVDSNNGIEAIPTPSIVGLGVLACTSAALLATAVHKFRQARHISKHRRKVEKVFDFIEKS